MIEKCICLSCKHEFDVQGSNTRGRILEIRCPSCGQIRIPERKCPSCSNVVMPKPAAGGMLKVIFKSEPQVKCPKCGYKGFTDEFILVLPLKNRMFYRF